MRRTANLLIFVAWIGIAGCGSGDDQPREEVGGTVTLDGSPLAEGRIEFQPLGPGIPAGASVERGTYRIVRADGPIPGRYRVNLSAAGAARSRPGSGPERAPGEPPGRAEPVAPELIPARYNAASTLIVEVKAGGGNQFDFPLDSAKGPSKSPSAKVNKR